NGDMLYLAPGTSKLTRAQGAYVSDEEIERVIDFFSDMEPEYSPELAQITAANSKKNSDGDSDRKEDSLYNEAVEIVIREGRGSVSLLQRALGVGYGRGARLIDYMAEDGIVGEYNGSQAREVLYTIDEWEAVKQNEFEDDYGEEEYEEEFV
ncbi:MAG: DNA translocase FtsK, partial [Planctomycetaceae bacterium]|nr:DNA translocase FtsK [Planctomycetaceae bacterium]